MKDLIIIGAGGSGRELLSHAIDIMKAGKCDWRVKGFIDDTKSTENSINTGYPILGPMARHEIEENAVYVCAIGDGIPRLKVGREFQKKGAEFINFINHT